MIEVLSWLNGTLYDGLPYALVTLSFVLTFYYARFADVTCASSFVLGGAVAAHSVVTLAWHPYGALAGSLAAGALGGLLTAFFHAGLRIDRLLAGILGAFALYSVNLLLLRPTLPFGHAPTVLTRFEVFDRSLDWAGLAWHPAAIAYFALTVLFVKGLLDFFFASELGLVFRVLRDETSGEELVTQLGFSAGWLKAIGLALGNGLVALAGALVSMKEGAANVHRGFDVLLTGLIAFLLGEQLWRLGTKVRRQLSRAKMQTALLQPRQITAAATTGALAYFALIGLAQRLDVPTEVTKLILALSVALAAGKLPLAAVPLRGPVRGLGRLRKFFPLRFRSRPPSEVTRALCSSEVALRSRWDAEDEAASQKPVAADEDPPAAELIDVSYTYPGNDQATLRGASLRVHKGEVLLLQGPNGAGKTTLLRLLAGAIPQPDSGRILLQGLDLTFDPQRRSRQVLWFRQQVREMLAAELSAEENLLLYALGGRARPWRRAKTNVRRRRMAQWAAEFHAGDLRLPVAALSGGQRQALALAAVQARASNPTLVLFDEPFNHLDSDNVKHCVELIQRLRKSAAIVLVSHTLPAGIQVDRKALLKEGKLVVG